MVYNKYMNNIKFKLIDGIKHATYCSICQQSKAEMKYTFSKDHKIQYYHCRQCNTLRVKKYRDTENGRLNIRKAVYKSINKYPQRQKARIAVQYAVKKGKLEKPMFCEKCNIESKLEAHHEDYSKPLEVIWLCKGCHILV